MLYKITALTIQTVKKADIHTAGMFGGMILWMMKCYKFAVILFAVTVSLIVAISGKNIFKNQDIEYNK